MKHIKFQWKVDYSVEVFSKLCTKAGIKIVWKNYGCRSAWTLLLGWVLTGEVVVFVGRLGVEPVFEALKGGCRLG